MRVILEVKKDRFQFFVELIKSLGFVKIVDDNSGIRQNQAVNDLKDAINDVKLHQQGRKKLKTIEEFMDETEW